jgi:hypothetical protein
VRSVARGAHHGDGFFDLRRVRPVAQALVAWCVADVEPRNVARRSTSTGAVEQKLGHDPSSGLVERTRRSAPGDARPSRADRRATASDAEQRPRSIRGAIAPASMR